MTRIPYQSIDLKAPVRVFLGRAKVSSVEAVKGGARIFRNIDGGLDFYTVEGGTAVPDLEIDASTVAAGVRIKDQPAIKGKGGKPKKGKGGDVDPDELGDFDVGVDVGDD